MTQVSCTKKAKDKFSENSVSDVDSAGTMVVVLWC